MSPSDETAGDTEVEREKLRVIEEGGQSGERADE